MKITQRKDGRYCTNITIPGKKRRMVYGKTKKEVREKAEKILDEVNKDEYVDFNPITVNEWFDYYLENCTLNIKKTTLTKYTSDIKNHIKPYFENVRLQDLNGVRIQTFINHLSEKLSPKSVRNVCSLMNNSLTIAVQLGKLGKNPCKNIILPKKVKPQIEILEEDDLSRFFKECEKYPEYKDIYEFLILTGLRIGELQGLTVDRYNRKKGTLTIDRQQTQSRTVDLILPKHDKVRTIYLSDRCKEIIENRIKRNGNKEYCNYHFIFINKNGTFYKLTALSKYFKKVLKAIGKENVRIHDLRHTYASMALKSGMDIKTLQNNLGHGTSSFTLDVYSHTTREMQKEGIENLDKFIQDIKNE